MKRKHPIIFTLALTCLLSACEDYNQFGNDFFVAARGYFLNTSGTDLQLEANGGKSRTQVSVTSYTTPWQFSGMASWLSVSPSSGNNSMDVTISALENTSGDDIRTTVFNFSSTDSVYPYEQEMSVTQACAEPQLIVPETDIIFSAAQASRSIPVDANIAYKVSLLFPTSSEMHDHGWLTATASDDGRTLLVTVDENLTGHVRSGEISLIGKAACSLHVSQQAACVESNVTDTIECPIEGASYQLTISSDVAWTAQSSSSTWIAVTPDSGNAGASKVVLDVAPNSSATERNGFVQVFTDTYKALTIPVHQVGLYVRPSKTKVNFGSEASSMTIDIESNTSWSVISKPDWLSVSVTSGTGDAQLTLTVSDNWSLQTLSGHLLIGHEGVSGLQCRVDVSQAARVFNDLIGSLSFGVEQQTQNAVIDTDGKWRATTTDSWIHLSPTSGTGQAEIAITVDANPLENERYGSVSVTVDDVSRTIAVEQKGRFFTVTGGDASIPSTGGKHKVTISSNTTWTATVSEPSWMHLSQSSGQGDIDVTLTADDNPSTDTRTNTTEFKAASISRSFRIVTTQAARYLKVDMESLTFLNVGGERPVCVSTDGTYEARVAEGNWIKLRQEGNVIYISAERNETGSQRSGKVIVSLTDLKSGSLTKDIVVVQLPKSSLFVQPFGADQQWELGSEGTLSVTISGFGADQQWDF